MTSSGVIASEVLFALERRLFFIRYEGDDAHVIFVLNSGRPYLRRFIKPVLQM